MNIQKKTIQQRVIELTEDQFNMLTGALVPATPQKIAAQAREMLPDRFSKGNDPEIMNKIQACRNFLNMVDTVSAIRYELDNENNRDQERTEEEHDTERHGKAS